MDYLLQPRIDALDAANASLASKLAVESLEHERTARERDALQAELGRAKIQIAVLQSQPRLQRVTRYAVAKLEQQEHVEICAITRAASVQTEGVWQPIPYTRLTHEFEWRKDRGEWSCDGDEIERDEVLEHEWFIDLSAIPEVKP